MIWELSCQLSTLKTTPLQYTNGKILRKLNQHGTQIPTQ